MVNIDAWDENIGKEVRLPTIDDIAERTRQHLWCTEVGIINTAPEVVEFHEPRYSRGVSWPQSYWAIMYAVDPGPVMYANEWVICEEDVPKFYVCARFIHTVCMRRIRWSCEGLTSVHNEYTGYTFKHLLLRHMYNLSLPVLLCYTQALRSETSYCYCKSLVNDWLTASVLVGVCFLCVFCVCVFCVSSVCLLCVFWLFCLFSLSVSHCTVQCFIYCLCRR